MVKGIITRTGNSYAIRVPKHYIDDNHLKLGDIVNVEEPLVEQQKALDALIRQGEERMLLSDPVQWQRERRNRESRKER